MSVVNAGEVFYSMARQVGARRADEFWAELASGRLPVRLVATTLARRVALC